MSLTQTVFEIFASMSAHRRKDGKKNHMISRQFTRSLGGYNNSN